MPYSTAKNCVLMQPGIHQQETESYQIDIPYIFDILHPFLINAFQIFPDFFDETCYLLCFNI